MAPITLRRIITPATYALLSLAIVGPWLHPGYIFALDMVFTPHLRMPETLSSSYLFHAFLHVVNYVLPSNLIQKLLLFALFFLSGLGMHRLARQLSAGRAGAYIAGVCYAVNPFVYDRLMTGQYSVLLGYALLPFFVRSLLAFLDKPAFRQSLRLALWATLVGVISIHTLGPIAVIALIGGTVWFVKNRHTHAWKKAFGQWSGAGVGMFALFNCYWLVPLLFGKGSTAEQIASFSSGDTTAFATIGSSFVAKLLHVLSLRGFWAENRDLYLQPNQQVGVWGIVLLLFWVLVIFGVIGLWRQKRRALAVLLVGIILSGSLLAVGPNFMHDVPLLAGFREPQKYASMVALGFAVLIGVSATKLIRFVRNEFDSPVTAGFAAGLVLLIPAVLASTIFWGARGQLVARNYPAKWAAINNQLSDDRDNFNTLFLPWHLYMRFGFADRVITHPGPAFFDKTVLVSDQAELGDTAPVHPTSTTQKLDQLLPHAAENPDFAKQLADLNIKYIILDHEEDYQDYDYLQTMPDLKRISQKGTLELYQNKLYGEAHETH
jgi:hypothetical protein